MLGPDATSVTYTMPGGQQATAPTAGPDGAFLIVFAHAGGPQGESGGPTLTDYSTNPIRGVSYTDRRSCKLPGPKALAKQQASDRTRFAAALTARFPALAKVELGGPNNASKQELAAARRIQRSSAYRTWARAHRALLGLDVSCPTVGYVPLRTPRLTSADVATPITVRTQTAKSLCTDNASEVTVVCGTVVPSGYQRQPASLAATNVLVTLTWKTRVAVTNQDSYYEVYTKATPAAGRGKCGTGVGFGPTETDFKAGQQVTYTTWMPLRCPGVSHGRVVFVQDTGPAGSMPVPAQPGEGPDIPVGKFSVVVP